MKTGIQLLGQQEVSPPKYMSTQSVCPFYKKNCEEFCKNIGNLLFTSFPYSLLPWCIKDLVSITPIFNSAKIIFNVCLFDFKRKFLFMLNIRQTNIGSNLLLLT